MEVFFFFYLWLDKSLFQLALPLVLINHKINTKQSHSVTSQYTLGLNKDLYKIGQEIKCMSVTATHTHKKTP